jgi:hypothetical protein
VTHTLALKITCFTTALKHILKGRKQLFKAVNMKEITFLIEEDPEGGYNAQGLGYSIFTEGETLEALKRNIIEAVRCHFDKTPGSRYGKI